MHDHSEHGRVTPPRDDQREARVEYGRQLAMDRIVLDEYRELVAPATSTSPTGIVARPHGGGRIVWIVAGLAASILGVWAIAWSTGSTQSGWSVFSADENASELAQREGSNLIGAATGRPGTATPVRVATQQEPRRNSGSVKAATDGAASGRAATGDAATGKATTSLPGPGTKLKKLAIPKRNAKGEIPIPASADPADIKLIRSAVAMFEAEEKLARMVKAGKIQGVDRMLSFEEIAAWPYEDGLEGMPEKLEMLDGQKVLMTGFMLPIDDVENIQEFLLVQSLWSCCYGQPPDINGTVRVILQGANRTDYEFNPIKLVGTFRIKPTIEDGFCVDIYQLEIERVEVIE